LSDFYIDFLNFSILIDTKPIKIDKSATKPSAKICDDL
jgi:hypothetical protein